MKHHKYSFLTDALRNALHYVIMNRFTVNKGAKRMPYAKSEGGKA